MIDANTGYVTGSYQTIRKTTNGGLNWQTISCPNYDYGYATFLNANTGIVGAGPGALMIQTYDGGNSWTVRFPPDYGGAWMQYIDSLTLYAIGGYSVMKSTSGGVSWFIVDTSSFYDHFRSVYFLNKDTGTVVGAHALVRTTTNGGASWTTRVVNLPVQFGDSTLYDVKYVNASTGFACGNGGIFIKTTNGGVNWTYYSTGAINMLQALWFNDTNTGYAVGNTGRIVKTTNGGVNWTVQTSPAEDPLWNVDFVDYNNGWVVGFVGDILYTSDGGLTWIQPISNQVPSEFKLFQNYPNPFNPSSKIKFQISKFGEVQLKIYDVLGREVSTLVNGSLKPGTYVAEWDGSSSASGVYYYRLSTGSFSEVKKMVLLK